MTVKTVGSINGGWSVLFRVSLATYPFVLAGIAWLITNQFKDNAFRDSGPRFTAVDDELSTARLRSEIMEVIASLPPPDWKDRINAIEVLSRSNSDKLTRVLTILEESNK